MDYAKDRFRSPTGRRPDIAKQSRMNYNGINNTKQYLKTAEKYLPTYDSGTNQNPITVSVSIPKKIRLDSEGREREKRKISNRENFIDPGRRSDEYRYEYANDSSSDVSSVHYINQLDKSPTRQGKAPADVKLQRIVNTVVPTVPRLNMQTLSTGTKTKDSTNPVCDASSPPSSSRSEKFHRTLKNISLNEREPFVALKARIAQQRESGLSSLTSSQQQTAEHSRTDPEAPVPVKKGNANNNALSSSSEDELELPVKTSHDNRDPVKVNDSPESVVVQPIRRKIATARDVSRPTVPLMKRSASASTALTDKAETFGRSKSTSSAAPQKAQWVEKTPGKHLKTGADKNEIKKPAEPIKPDSWKKGMEVIRKEIKRKRSKERVTSPKHSRSSSPLLTGRESLSDAAKDVLRQIEDSDDEVEERVEERLKMKTKQNKEKSEESEKNETTRGKRYNSQTIQEYMAKKKKEEEEKKKSETRNPKPLKERTYDAATVQEYMAKKKREQKLKEMQEKREQLQMKKKKEETLKALQEKSRKLITKPSTLPIPPSITLLSNGKPDSLNDVKSSFTIERSKSLVKDESSEDEVDSDTNEGDTTLTEAELVHESPNNKSQTPREGSKRSSPVVSSPMSARNKAIEEEIEKLVQEAKLRNQSLRQHASQATPIKMLDQLITLDVDKRKSPGLAAALPIAKSARLTNLALTTAQLMNKMDMLKADLENSQFSRSQSRAESGINRMVTSLSPPESAFLPSNLRLGSGQKASDLPTYSTADLPGSRRVWEAEDEEASDEEHTHSTVTESDSEHSHSSVTESNGSNIQSELHTESEHSDMESELSSLDIRIKEALNRPCNFTSYHRPVSSVQPPKPQPKVARALAFEDAGDEHSVINTYLRKLQSDREALMSKPAVTCSSLSFTSTQPATLTSSILSYTTSTQTSTERFTASAQTDGYLNQEALVPKMLGAVHPPIVDVKLNQISSSTLPRNAVQTPASSMVGDVAKSDSSTTQPPAVKAAPFIPLSLSSENSLSSPNNTQPSGSSVPKRQQPSDQTAAQSKQSSAISSGQSSSGSQPLKFQPISRISPAGLDLALSTGISMLDSLNQQQIQLNDVERTRFSTLAQQETVALAQILKGTRDRHDQQLLDIRQRIKAEEEESQKQLEMLRKAAEEANRKREEAENQRRRDNELLSKDTTRKVVDAQTESMKAMAEAAKLLSNHRDTLSGVEVSLSSAARSIADTLKAQNRAVTESLTSLLDQQRQQNLEIIRIAQTKVKQSEINAADHNNSSSSSSRAESVSSPDSLYTQDSASPREAKDAKALVTSRSPRGARSPRDSKSPRDSRQSKDTRITRSARSPRNIVSPRGSRSPQGSKFSKDSKAVMDSRKSPKPQKNSKSPRMAKSPLLPVHGSKDDSEASSIHTDSTIAESVASEAASVSYSDDFSSPPANGKSASHISESILDDARSEKANDSIHTISAVESLASDKDDSIRTDMSANLESVAIRTASVSDQRPSKTNATSSSVTKSSESRRVIDSDTSSISSAAEPLHKVIIGAVKEVFKDGTTRDLQSDPTFYEKLRTMLISLKDGASVPTALSTPSKQSPLNSPNKPAMVAPLSPRIDRRLSFRGPIDKKQRRANLTLESESDESHSVLANPKIRKETASDTDQECQLAALQHQLEEAKKRHAMMKKARQKYEFQKKQEVYKKQIEYYEEDMQRMQKEMEELAALSQPSRTQSSVRPQIKQPKAPSSSGSENGSSRQRHSSGASDAEAAPFTLTSQPAVIQKPPLVTKSLPPLSSSKSTLERQRSDSGRSADSEYKERLSDQYADDFDKVSSVASAASAVKSDIRSPASADESSPIKDSETEAGEVRRRNLSSTSSESIKESLDESLSSLHSSVGQASDLLNLEPNNKLPEYDEKITALQKTGDDVIAPATRSRSSSDASSKTITDDKSDAKQRKSPARSKSTSSSRLGSPSPSRSKSRSSRSRSRSVSSSRSTSVSTRTRSRSSSADKSSVASADKEVLNRVRSRSLSASSFDGSIQESIKSESAKAEVSDGHEEPLFNLDSMEPAVRLEGPTSDAQPVSNLINQISLQEQTDKASVHSDAVSLKGSYTEDFGSDKTASDLLRKSESSDTLDAESIDSSVDEVAEEKSERPDSSQNSLLDFEKQEILNQSGEKEGQGDQSKDSANISGLGLSLDQSGDRETLSEIFPYKSSKGQSNEDYLQSLLQPIDVNESQVVNMAQKDELDIAKPPSSVEVKEALLAESTPREYQDIKEASELEIKFAEDPLAVSSDSSEALVLSDRRLEPEPARDVNQLTSAAEGETLQNERELILTSDQSEEGESESELDKVISTAAAAVESFASEIDLEELNHSQADVGVSIMDETTPRSMLSLESSAPEDLELDQEVIEEKTPRAESPASSVGALTPQPSSPPAKEKEAVLKEAQTDMHNLVSDSMLGDLSNQFVAESLASIIDLWTQRKKQMKQALEESKAAAASVPPPSESKPAVKDSESKPAVKDSGKDEQRPSSSPEMSPPKTESKGKSVQSSSLLGELPPLTVTIQKVKEKDDSSSSSSDESVSPQISPTKSSIINEARHEHWAQLDKDRDSLFGASTESDWFDEDFGLGNDAKPVGAVPTKELPGKKAVLEPIFVIPHTEDEIQAFANEALNMFWQARRCGEPWDSLTPPADFLAAGDKLGTEASSTSAFKHFVFDIIKDLLMDMYQTEDPGEETLIKQRTMLSYGPLTKYYRYRQPPTTLDEVRSIIQKHIYPCVSGKIVQTYHTSSSRKSSQAFRILAASRQRRRDRVDVILTRELREEEASWLDISCDEVAVKNVLIEDVFKVLLDDSLKSMKESFNKLQRSQELVSS